MLLIIFLMLVFNAFFAAYEMALAAVSKARLAALTEQKRRGAKEALYMKERMEASLAVIQLGITLVGAIAAATGGANADEAFVPFLMVQFGFSRGLAEFLAMTLVIVPLSAVTIVFGELIPKTFALSNKEWVCLKMSPTMKILNFLFYPPVYILEKIVKITTIFGSSKVKQTGHTESTHVHELRAAASLARTSRLIGAQEERIVHSATEISKRSLKDILIPTHDITMIPVTLPLSEALICAHMDMHTRFPVCETEGDAQSIIGYVNFKDIIFALHLNPQDPSLRGIVRPIKSIKASVNVPSALEEMIQGSTHIAIVRDEQGRVAGLVTMEDLLEEVVGEIQDEYDRMPVYIHPYLTGWIVGGGVSMKEIYKITSVPADADANLTVSQWCKKHRPAFKGGETLDRNGLTVTARKLRRKEVSEAFVLKI